MSAYSMLNALMTPGLTANESRVYVYLVGRANGAKVCWPSVAEIAAHLDTAERTVINATTRLHALGLIKVRKRYRDTNNYLVLDVEGLHDKPAFAKSRFEWSENDTTEEVQKTTPIDGVQKTTPMDPDGVQKTTPMDPLGCNLRQSGVQKTTPESVQQESNKEDKNPLRGVGAGASAPATPSPADKSNVVVLATRQSAQSVAETWNAMAGRHELPLLAGTCIPPFLQGAFKRRLAEVGVEDLLRAIACVGASAFCKGDNDRGWRADLGFVLQAKSLSRLLSGYYADHEKRGLRKSGIASLQQRWNLTPMRPNITDEPADEARRIGS